MKIAVFHSLISGGAKRALFEMVKRLSDKHLVDIYTLCGAEHTFCDLKPFSRNHNVYDFDTLPLLKSPLGLLNHGIRTLDIFRLRLVQKRIANDIDAGGYDVVFVHPDQYTTSPWLLRFLSTSSVYYCQDPLRKIYDPVISRPYLGLTGIRKWVDALNPLKILYFNLVKTVDRTNLRASDLVLVNSYFSRETIYRIYGIAPVVCYLGIDTTNFGVPDEVQTRTSDYILSVGSVNPIKGFDFIIDSLANVPKNIRPKLIIVGNFSVEQEQNYLLEKAKMGGVTVDFRIMVSDQELKELYQKAFVTVYAPVLEPFGFVPLESMACGTPVVGVAEGGIRETIRHNETGLLADRQPQQFATAIVKLLTNESFTEKLGAYGPDYVQECWNWENCIEQIVSHLYEVALL